LVACSYYSDWKSFSTETVPEGRGFPWECEPCNIGSRNSDMESTVRYLKPFRSQAVLGKVEGIFA
jgi:hypothetical protein